MSLLTVKVEWLVALRKRLNEHSKGTKEYVKIERQIARIESQLKVKKEVNKTL